LRYSSPGLRSVACRSLWPWALSLPPLTGGFCFLLQLNYYIDSILCILYLHY
jgi:hypothetical protein